MCAKLIQTPGTDTCPQCHTDYKSITNHWHASSECTFPPIPAPVKDIVYGILSVKGSIQRKEPPRRNSIRVNSTRLNTLRELSKVLGVFVTNKPIKEKENVSEIYDSHKGVNTNYELILRPLPDIQDVPSYSDPKKMEYVPNEYFIKAAFSIQGRVGNGSASIRLPKKRAENRGGLIFEKFFKSKSIDNREYGDYVTYSAPYQDIKDWIEVEWPRGWWNEQYMD